MLNAAVKKKNKQTNKKTIKNQTNQSRDVVSWPHFQNHNIADIRHDQNNQSTSSSLSIMADHSVAVWMWATTGCDTELQAFIWPTRDPLI